MSSKIEFAGITWWKWVCILLLFYSLIQGLLIPVPRLPILHETIRNLFFHVTMWFAMIIMMLASLVYAIRFLGSNDLDLDIKSEQCAYTGIFLGILGLVTGSIWAKNTWGAWWVNDAKLNGAAATMLVYLAYLILRGSLDDEHKRARLSAVYSIFAFTLMLVFIMILPRLTDSLHPGNGGNPGFSSYDLDNRMRTVFYPSVIAWSLLAAWVTEIRVRMKRLKLKNEN
ncbi:MAG: cytochrome c biogenesis protein CcsA [Bacteroidetes bacterium]|nr:cytochrome c biogenesis protein CcsA [Bacteroidota bacterium]